MSEKRKTREEMVSELADKLRPLHQSDPDGLGNVRFRLFGAFYYKEISLLGRGAAQDIWELSGASTGKNYIYQGITLGHYVEIRKLPPSLAFWEE